MQKFPLFITSLITKIQVTGRSKTILDSSNPDPPVGARKGSCSLAGEPFLEELLVPRMVQDLRSGSREKPNLDGQSLIAALGCNALGKVAA